MTQRQPSIFSFQFFHYDSLLAIPVRRSVGVLQRLFLPPQTKPFLSALPCLSLSHFSLCGTHIPSFIPRSSAAPGEAEGVSRHDDTPTSSLQSEPDRKTTHTAI